MAIYTLPNGSTWNTGLSYFEQPDVEAYNFVGEVETGNEPVQTFISGPNPNLPRVKTQTWTETSYDDYNYIYTTSFSYKGNSYTKQNVLETFTIENK